MQRGDPRVYDVPERVRTLVGVTGISAWAEQLGNAVDCGAFLTQNSGLPGPRCNLELADAFAAIASEETIRAFAESDDEYLRFCGTEALGRLVLADPRDREVRMVLLHRASDNLWRVREGAARALQLVGDGNLALMRSIVTEWIENVDPFVRRAAVAAICEPRLLHDTETQVAALTACAVATESIRLLPATERKQEDVRNLRQALGYCWSVAVAAAPHLGLARWKQLVESTDHNSDVDIAWIVKTNLTKKRLARLFG